jgi:hypothetical protein
MRPLDSTARLGGAEVCRVIVKRRIRHRYTTIVTMM